MPTHLSGTIRVEFHRLVLSIKRPLVLPAKNRAECLVHVEECGATSNLLYKFTEDVSQDKEAGTL